MSSSIHRNDPDLDIQELAAAAEAAIADALSKGSDSTASVLAGAGLTSLLIAEESGGLGLGLREALPIAEAAGALQLRWPLVEQMVLAAAFSGTTIGSDLVSAERLATVAWQGSLDEGIAGPARALDLAHYVLVRSTDGAVLIDTSSLELSRFEALDPGTPEVWARWSGSAPVILATLDEPQTEALWRQVQLLCAAEVKGAAASALRLTAEHVATRAQFGGPLSARQAVRHQMARMQLSVEVMSASIERAVCTNDWGGMRDVRPVLAGAIEHGAFVLERAIHLHGAMGFTWDVPLHGSLRAIRALDASLGTVQATFRLGQDLIDGV